MLRIALWFYSVIPRTLPRDVRGRVEPEKGSAEDKKTGT